MKRQWQIKNPNHLNLRPNVVIGANAHICVNKFAQYFDVEARIVPVSERTMFTVDAEAVRELLDENTGRKFFGPYSILKLTSLCSSGCIFDIRHNLYRPLRSY